MEIYLYASPVMFNGKLSWKNSREWELKYINRKIKLLDRQFSILHLIKDLWVIIKIKENMIAYKFLFSIFAIHFLLMSSTAEKCIVCYIPYIPYIPYPMNFYICIIFSESDRRKMDNLSLATGIYHKGNLWLAKT
jgi:hypothetical protein